jgi:exodeoxyribonuclease VII small subunit
MNDENQVNLLSFENAFQELEEIVSLLEADHTLEDALRLYERGQALARRCASLLDQAELKVEQVSGESLDLDAPQR